MEKTKKIFALFLTCVMILSVACTGVFADDGADSTVAATTTFSDVEIGTTIGDAVSKLVAYGIISGYPDGTFKPEGAITRAEFAAVVARFKGIANAFGEDVVTGFSDLDSDSSSAWARPYVKASVDYNIINGFEDGTFRASEQVTYEQAIKMIICAIDYTPVANSELSRIKISNPDATWSAGYISAANKNGITTGALTADITGSANRGTVAVLVSNALEAPVLKVVTDKNGNVSYEKSENSIADDQSNSKELVEGYVSGTYYTGLDNQFPDISLKEINIMTGDREITYELSSALQNSIDFEDIVGKRVTAYYSKDDDCLVQIQEKGNTTLKIDESQIASISGNNLKYTDAKGKNVSESLSGYTFIYNGKYMPAASLSDFADGGSYPLRNGYIELVKSSSLKIAKITSYDVWVVNSYDRTNEKIYFKYNKTYNGEKYYIFPAKSSDIPDIYLAGKKIEYSALSLTAYDVINVLFSPEKADGNPVRKMFITKGAKSGKVTAKTDDYREVEIAGNTLYLTRDYEEYTPSGSDEQKAPFELDETYNYYLDYTGQIAAVKYSEATSGTYKYGYLIDVAKSQKDTTYSARLITQEGKDSKYALKSTVKIDGNKVKDSSAREVLVSAAEGITANYNNAIDNAAASDELYGADKLNDACAQPIRYALSGSTIETIDTVAEGAGGSSDSFSYDVTLAGGKTTVNSTTSFKNPSQTFGASSSTKVFYVPVNRSDTNSYSVLTNTKAFTNKGTKYIEAFNIDSSTTNKNAGMIVLYAKADPSLVFNGSSKYMLVTKILHDSDTTSFEGYVGNAKTTTTVKVSEDKFTTAISEVVGSTEYDSIDFDEIEKGDIIRYITDGSGEIIAIRMMYDASSPIQKEPVSTHAEALKNRNFGTTSQTNFYFKYGMPLELSTDSNTFILTSFTTDDSADESELTNSAYGLSFSKSSANVYEINSKGEVTVLETLDSVYDWSSGAPSRIIVISSYQSTSAANAARTIYLIND